MPRSFILFLAILFGWLSLAQAADMPDRRFEKLRRGVNIHYWVDEKNAALINLDAPTNHITEEDARLIKRMGFTHVRLAVSPYAFLQNLHFQEENLRTPAATQLLGEIHRITELFVENGIAVVLTVVVRPDVEAKLYYDKGYDDEWAGFFWHWGREFSTYDPEYLFFETINEPNSYQFIAKDRKLNPEDSKAVDAAMFDANKRWQGMQEKFIQALRVHAKTNTIIAVADDRESYFALLHSTPIADANVIYGFHYYFPFVFTHQGADWTDMPSPIDSLTYPPYESNCMMVSESVGKAQRDAVSQYCKESWGRKRHEFLLGAMKDWAKKYNVKVWAGEFGVFPNKAEKTSVFNYLFDTRNVFEAYGFGWCVWEYAGWLGRLDSPRIKEALGVK